MTLPFIMVAPTGARRGKADHTALPVTTESAGRFNVPEQLACLEDLEPDWASVSVREITRAPQLAHRLYHGCAERGTRVQHILYDPFDAEQLLTADGTPHASNAALIQRLSGDRE